MDFAEPEEDAYLPSEDVAEEYTVSDAVSPPQDTDDEEQDEGVVTESEEENVTPVNDEVDLSRQGHHPLSVFSGLQAEAYCADFFPEKSWLLAGGGDDFLYIFDCSCLQVLCQSDSFEDSIIFCRFIVFDDEEGEHAGSIEEDKVLALGVAMNGKCRLISPSPSNSINMVGSRCGGEVVSELHGPEEVIWTQLSRDHRRLWLIGADGTVWVVGLDGRVLTCLHVGASGHAANVTVAAISPQESHLLTGDSSGLVVLWSGVQDCPTVSGKFHFPPSKAIQGTSGRDEESRELSALYFHPGTLRTFVAASVSGRFVVMHESTVLHQGSLTSSIEAVLWLTAFPTIILSDMTGALISLDANSFHERWRISLDDGVTQMRPCIDPHCVVAALANGAMVKVDVRSGSILSRWMGSADGPTPVHSLHLTPISSKTQPTFLVAAFEDGNVQVYQDQ